MTRLIYFGVPILAGWFKIRVVDNSLWAAIFFWLLLFTTNTLTIRYLSNQVRTSKWTNIYDSIFFPFLVGPILLELFGLELKTFKVTDKDKENDSGFAWNYSWPFILLFDLNILAILRVLYSFLFLNEYTDAVTFFWLIYNQMLATMSLIFMVGRSSASLTALRKAAIYVRGQQKDHEYKDHEYMGAINGLSEYEMQIIWDSTANPPQDGPIDLIVKDIQGKDIILKGTIISIFRFKNLWISEVIVNEMPENEFNAFIELVYD